ncbi:T9SS type A sorting domain-containing protein [Winogradskyella sp.]|uniref:T9SS type A sorting domain-containing protein n=1 Tax=Winogradskyella sp. TaxID=1883156 RepID=UPI002634CCE7|nr:T9SS type A sorting domain-containing protein [Winogradskyella sp.]
MKNSFLKISPLKKVVLFLMTFSVFTVTTKGQDRVTVTEGTSLVVGSEASFTNADIVLKSTSNSYSNLILDGSLGTSSADVHYDRYVNAIGSGTSGGNDLVALPVFDTGFDFVTLLTFGDNQNVIANNPSDVSVFAFGPYDNDLRAYINYDSDNVDLLEEGKGYRAATELASDHIIRFSGKVRSTDVANVSITTSSMSNSRWNLVGNPYPSYIKAQEFLIENTDADPALSTLDPSAAAIYGYTDGTFSGPGQINNFIIINNMLNTDVNIAPGQGFFVSDNPANSNTLAFTTAMRSISGTDDFILGRPNGENYRLRLLASDNTNSYPTEFYFNADGSLGLDIGYDAAIYSGSASNFELYSNLVENNAGRKIAVQALSDNDMTNVIIPLGLKASQGEQVVFSIEDSSLPEATQVYLEDNVFNTFTLLNNEDYTFVPSEAIDGTGRFFLHFGNITLGVENQVVTSLQLFSVDQTIYVEGQLLEDSTLSVFDIQGRLVLSDTLAAGRNTHQIDASRLASNVYIVKLSNYQQEKTEKLIIK